MVRKLIFNEHFTLLNIVQLCLVCLSSSVFAVKVTLFTQQAEPLVKFEKTAKMRYVYNIYGNHLYSQHHLTVI